MATADSPALPIPAHPRLSWSIPIFPMLVVLHVLCLVTGPGLILAAVWGIAATWLRFVMLVAALPLAGAVYGLSAALLSRPYQSSIRATKMKRDVTRRDYRDRRLYGFCWTALYYCTPVYHMVLSVPCLKRWVFRLFGYRGSMDFTAYPDTWIRDLPLLDFGEGSYVSNRATIGTNVVLSNGRILVNRVTVGKNALVGHLSMVGPGAVIGAGAEIGVGAAVGFGAKIEEGVSVGPMSTVDHGARIGCGARIGTTSYIGARAEIAPGLVVPPGTVVPPRARIRGADDLAALAGSGQTRISQRADRGLELVELSSRRA